MTRTTKPLSPLSPEEQRLFEESVRGAKRLKYDRIPPYRAPLKSRSPQREESAPDYRDDLLSDQVSQESLPNERELLFVRSGLQHRLVKQLRQGKIRYQAELDLHGLTTLEARHELTEFLHMATEAGLRCLLIIHGKGYGSEGQEPILKRRVNYWLRQRGEVLAFCSATRRDGGEGALYLLLRRDVQPLR